MVSAEGGNLPGGSQTPKVYRRSDVSMPADSLKLETQVSAHEHEAVYTFPGLVATTRESMRVGGTSSGWAKPSERQAPKVWLIIRVKS